MSQPGILPGDPSQKHQITVDTQDFQSIRPGLESWLGQHLGEPVLELSADESGLGNGMSSVTVICTAQTASGERPLVVRLPPNESNVPIFPGYDFGLQYDVMSAVAAGSDVPVPPLVGCEPTGSVLGVPFLVMEQVTGQVPTDNPPYVFGGWLLEASAEQQRLLQQTTIEVIAGVHSVADPGAALPKLAARAGLRNHVDDQRAFYEWTCEQAGGTRLPLVDRAFEWIEAHWPAQVSPDVLCWGDARIGNILFCDFAPAAVLDWEMALIGPPELDLGWAIFMHRFFQDIAEVFEMPGIPGFLQAEDVAASYAGATDRPVQDLNWYLTWAAIRHAIVMRQAKRRMIHFGEDTAPEDPDDYILHRAALEELISR
ncbi:MAG TPA: phosphotransferase family protein [Marmoricola sp.]|nr:phosphotransferase family protein [Marmoricola sp.]